MRAHEIEAWTHAIVERALLGAPNEDARVELKAIWPSDHARAARRLAGHANAARGEPILWLIGIDERGRRVVPLEIDARPDWLAGLRRQFDGGFMPAIRDLVVPTQHGPVVSLYIETDRAPFVVRNVLQGRSGETVEWEVPWREGTAVRSAKRHELLKILVPQARLPLVDPLLVHVDATPAARGFHPERVLAWAVQVHLYVVPAPAESVVFPAHMCALCLRTGRGRLAMWAPEVEFQADQGSPNVTTTVSEALVVGPGKVRASAFFDSHHYDFDPEDDLTINLSLRPAGADTASHVERNLLPISPATPARYVWRWTQRPFQERRTDAVGGLLPPRALEEEP